MSIQRQYSLPNCVFILEGLSNTPNGSSSGSRPELSILTRFECHFAKQKQALVGGRDLLQELIYATNDCVQSWVSGIPSAPRRHGKDHQPIVLKPSHEGGFELTVPDGLLSKGLSQMSEPSQISDPTVTQLRISSVQLFDLVEAIDQLAADQQTLPDLHMMVRPRSRKETIHGQMAVEQATPIAVGAASVAVAAAAFFFMPVPKAPTLKEPQALPSPAASQPFNQPITPLPTPSPETPSSP